MKTPRFFLCQHCKNLITLVEDKGVPVFCCGEKMIELKANTTEAANEKHLPVINVEGNVATVTVGSVTHPMQDEHHIAWIYLETTNGGQLRYLEHTAAPEVTFALAPDEKVISAFAYCNLHGLWRTEA